MQYLSIVNNKILPKEIKDLNKQKDVLCSWNGKLNIIKVKKSSQCTQKSGRSPQRTYKILANLLSFFFKKTYWQAEWIYRKVKNLQYSNNFERKEQVYTSKFQDLLFSYSNQDNSVALFQDVFLQLLEEDRVQKHTHTYAVN